MQYNIVHSTPFNTAVTEVEHDSVIELTGELWGASCEDSGEDWLRYNGTALYYIQHGNYEVTTNQRDFPF